MFQVFQVFHLDVAKVDRDIAHVAMAIYTRMVQVYVLNVSAVFQKHVASVCSKCFS
jgi:hypothetical protein